MAKKEIKPPHTDQHIIPKCYLKAWNDNTLINKDSGKPFNEPQVWAYNKISGESEQLSAKTNFTQEDFYTIKDEQRERDLTIEHALGRAEDKFDWIRDNKLLKNEDFDEQERLDICLFIATMHNRTISRINHLGDMLKPIQERLKSYKEFAKTATVEELKKSGTTVVIITHRQNILKATNKIVLMNSGRIEKYGISDDIFKKIVASKPFSGT